METESEKFAVSDTVLMSETEASCGTDKEEEGLENDSRYSCINSLAAIFELAYSSLFSSLTFPTSVTVVVIVVIII